MTLTLPVDVEQVIYQFLSTDTDVQALSPTLCTVVPEDVFNNLPIVRYVRVGGGPLMNYPLVIDQPRVQIDVWAENKTDAWTLARTVQAAMSMRLKGSVQTGGLVTALAWEQVIDAYDSSVDPPICRVILDVVLTTKPR